MDDTRTFETVREHAYSLAKFKNKFNRKCSQSHPTWLSGMLLGTQIYATRCSCTIYKTRHGLEGPEVEKFALFLFTFQKKEKIIQLKIANSSLKKAMRSQLIFLKV